MNPIGDTTIGTIANWLGGLTRRQQAISTNVANIDTPGYQRQEVSFESALQQASKGRMALTNPKHMAAPGSRTALGLQGAESLNSARLDKNTVSIDQEMIGLAETQMKYSAAANALNTKIATLREVIRG